MRGLWCFLHCYVEDKGNLCGFSRVTVMSMIVTHEFVI